MATTLKYMVKELTDDGGVTDVVTREMYDYEDSHHFAHITYDSTEALIVDVVARKDSIRHASRLVILTVLEI